jgi:hypothetical protein
LLLPPSPSFAYDASSIAATRVRISRADKHRVKRQP